MEETYASELLKKSFLPDGFIAEYTRNLNPRLDDLHQFFRHPWAEPVVLPIKLDPPRVDLTQRSTWISFPPLGKPRKVCVYLIHNQ